MVYAVRHKDYRVVPLLTINNLVIQRARKGKVKDQHKLSRIFRFKIFAMTGNDPKWIEYSDLSFKEVGAPLADVLPSDMKPFVAIPQGCGCECAGCSDQGWHCHKAHEDCYL